MAKKAQTKPVVKGSSHGPSPAEPATLEIREFHQLGVRVRRLASEDNRTISETAAQIAHDESISFDRARKAAHFAELCDKKELDRICGLRIRSGTAPLTVNHIRAVLKIDDRKERFGWLKRAAEEGMPASSLRRAIGPSTEGKGGPKLTKPGDLLDALNQVIGRSDDWIKRYEDHWKDDACWPPMIGYGVSDRAVLAERLKMAIERMAALGAAVKVMEGRFGKLGPKLCVGEGTQEAVEESKAGSPGC